MGNGPPDASHISAPWRNNFSHRMNSFSERGLCISRSSTQSIARAQHTQILYSLSFTVTPQHTHRVPTARVSIGVIVVPSFSTSTSRTFRVRFILPHLDLHLPSSRINWSLVLFSSCLSLSPFHPIYHLCSVSRLAATAPAASLSLSSVCW
jgi:hypothetical protein